MIDPRWLREEHHNWYGRPWIMGAYQMEFLLAHGVHSYHVVADLGCGSGRLGRWLVRYLTDGAYWGIDPNIEALAAFRDYECYGADTMRARIYCDPAEIPDDSCDVVVDFSVSMHLDGAALAAYRATVERVLKRAGRYFVMPSPQANMIGTLHCVDRYVQDIPALHGTPWNDSCLWGEYVRR